MVVEQCEAGGNTPSRDLLMRMPSSASASGLRSGSRRALAEWRHTAASSFDTLAFLKLDLTLHQAVYVRATGGDEDEDGERRQAAGWSG